MKKRLLSFFLVLCMVCALLPMVATAEDYRSWAQSDSRWGSIRMGSGGPTISNSGCLVTSVTKLIIQCGLKDANSFNVATLANYLNNNNGYASGGNLYYGAPAKLVSGFVNYGDLTSYGSYSSSGNNDLILSWIKSGYHMAINVNSGGHWVAVDEAKSLATGTIYIMDSLYGTSNADITLAGRYSIFNSIHAWKGGSTPDASDPNKIECVGINIPDVIIQGSSCDISGQIITGSPITWIWNGVNKRGTNNHLLDSNRYPNSYIFDVESFANDLAFETLEPGEYTYSIEGNCNGKYEVFYRKDFAVESPYMNITNISFPKSIKEGSSVNVTGKVTSNSVITWIWNGVFVQGTSEHILESVRYPGATVFDVKSFADDLAFNKLEPGEYTYSIEGMSNGQYYVVYRVDFSVLPNHTHSYTARVVKPTCTDEGYTLNTCSCGDSYRENYTAALGHAWDSGKVTKAATETSTGIKTFTCTRCGTTKTEIIPVLTHTHKYTAVVTNPTCTEQGYTTHTCSCGDSYKDTYTAALGHAWDSGRITKQPTETSTGIKTFNCTRCTATKNETIPPLSHTHSYAAVVTKPTCMGKGYTTYICSCGDSYKSDYVASLGHNYVNSVCTRCGADDPNYNPTPVNPFTDISALSQSFRTAIIWASSNGIAAGATKTTYNPNGSCTRGQVVTFLWRAAGKPEPTTTVNPYNDVASTAYYYKAILWAAENGITAGYNNPDGSKSFKPGDTVTRGQFVTFLWRYLGKPAPTSTVNPFNDVKSGGFYNAILWGSENGIVAGYNVPGGMEFRPNNPCTRAHVAVFLYRAMA